VVGLIGPLSQALFPRSARAGAGTRDEMIAHVRRIAPYLVGLGLALGAGTLLLAPVLGPLVFGPDFDESIHLLQIMSLIPVAIAVATLLGPQVMLAVGLDRVYSAVIVAVGVFNVGLMLVLAPRFEATGTAIAATVSECLVAVSLFAILLRRHRRAARRQPA
jgi:PST family polysaccharide transporter